MKRKIFFTIVLLLSILTSCSYFDISDDIPKSWKDIRIFTTAQYDDVEFVVFCYETEAPYLGISDLGEPYINGLRVDANLYSEYLYGIPGYKCDFSGTYYWPDENRLQAFAIFPFDKFILDYKVEEKSYPSFKYIIADAEESKEIFVSTLQDEKREKDEYFAFLNFEFVPILSKINLLFEGKEEEYIYFITDVEFQNFKSKGKFTFANAYRIGSWSEQEENINYSYSLSSPFIVCGKSLKDFYDSESMLTLIPQEFSEETKFKITYSVRNSKTGLDVYKGSKYVDVSNYNLEKGNIIDFCFTLPIDESKISFTTKYNEDNREKPEDRHIVKLNKAKTTIVETDTEQLELSFNFEYEYEYDDIYTWSTSDSSVASVDRFGLVTAVGNGTAVISAYVALNEDYFLYNNEPQCKVTVTDIITIPDVLFKKELLDSDINLNGDDKISMEEALNAKSLRISSKGISSLEGIRYFKNLKKIICSKNNLSILNLSGFSNLEYLDCSDNKIENLNIEDCSNLETLDCSNNKLKSFEEESCYKLKILECSNNLINRMSVLNYEELEILNCSYNQLKTVDITANKLLSEFDCKNNDDLESIYVWRNFDKQDDSNFSKPSSAIYVKE
ncbi:MAG: leucine-rich repeat domain-containing protein [Bacteroidetes bacterium]|nr:leucine-rich repeat domain-containing protein [Bacteroidota bacterium]